MRLKTLKEVKSKVKIALLMDSDYQILLDASEGSDALKDLDA